MKKTKKTARQQKLLKNCKLFAGIDRKPMPRPAVFKDKTKYDRNALKKESRHTED